MAKTTLFENARILTMADSIATAGSMLVEDGRVIALDPGASTLPVDIRRVDLGGRNVMPGLIDAHSHMEMIAYAWGIAVEIKPPAARSIGDLVAILRNKAEQTPSGGWILGQGMHYQDQHMV